MEQEYLNELRKLAKALRGLIGARLAQHFYDVLVRCGEIIATLAEDQSQTRERMVFRKAGLNLFELGEALRGTFPGPDAHGRHQCSARDRREMQPGSAWLSAGAPGTPGISSARPTIAFM